MIYQLTRFESEFQLIKFDSGFVEYLINEYLPDNSLVIPNMILPYDVDYIKLARQINIYDEILTVFFDCSGDPINVEQRIEQIKKSGLTKPFYILTGLFKYHNNPASDSRIVFFPFWCMWMSKPYAPLLSIDKHEFSNTPKQYKLSCLNGTYWNHRILTYLYLTERAYFNDIMFSFGNRQRFDDLVNECVLTIDEINRFAQLPQTVQFLTTDTQIDVTINHPAYLETYINLVTETNIRVSTPMLSEKSFKPIVAGQLFILIAAQGAIQFLRDIEIDTFDDIIDHSYDTIVDHRERIHTAIAQVDQLMTLDLAMIYDQIKPRLQHNSIYFTSEEFKKQFPSILSTMGVNND